MTGHTLEGKFVKCGPLIAYVRHGRLRPVRDVETLASLRIPGEIVEVAPDALSNLRRGAFAPWAYDKGQWVERRADTHSRMRELMTSVAEGRGVEFGAGPTPLPIPLDCDVIYADAFDTGLIQAGRMFAESADDMIGIDVRDSFEEFSSFESGSLDFVVASHVIEHLTNPVGAIVTAFDRLRDGGWIFLVVPDKRYTFDKNRELTSLDHLMRDFHEPDRQRDFQHYLDFYQVSANSANFHERAIDAYEKGLDVHFHTWTCQTFFEMIDHLSRASLARWRNVWWQPKIASDDYAIEFYFALQK